MIRYSSFLTRQNLPYPVAGYDEVSERLTLLDNFVQKNGPVECIVLGSSLVAVGFNPVVFNETYQQHTGEAINCFNFGVSAATGSSLGAIASILAHQYHPDLMILAINPRAFDGRDSYEMEHQFQYTPWAKYHLGKITFQGWLLEHLYIYRYLDYLPSIIGRIRFPESTELPIEEEARPTGIEARIFNDHYAPMIFFQEHAPLWNIRDGLAQELRKVIRPYPLSQEDFDGLKHIVALASEEQFALVVVEIPSPDPYFEYRSEAPEPTARHTFIGTIGAYCQEHGIPFWELGETAIPYTDYGDGIHMYVSGSTDYSWWLGQQTGEAVLHGLLDGKAPAQFISAPPLPNLEMSREYLATRGLSPQNETLYRQYLENIYALTPADSIILNLQSTQLDHTYIQTILGFMIEYGAPIDEQNRKDWFDLRVIQERMIYPEELSAQAKELLDQWRQTYQPALMQEMDVDYILYTERWNKLSAAPEQTKESLSQYYSLIKSWDFIPLQETYYLYASGRSQP